MFLSEFSSTQNNSAYISLVHILIFLDTKAEEVGVGASLAVQCVAVSETVVAVGVQYAVLVQKTGGLQ